MSTTQAKYASTQSGVYSGNITIVLYTLCTNKEPTTKKASWYGNANKTAKPPCPCGSHQKRILDVLLNTKDSIMIVRLSCVSIGLGIIILKQDGI